MAICYECGEKFYGNHCSECGWEIEYDCWNCSEVINSTDSKCANCGWFNCSNCGECGCNEMRPDSNEEKQGLRERW